jgi:glycerophosphoryl diester phosphodiesterase
MISFIENQQSSKMYIQKRFFLIMLIAFAWYCYLPASSLSGSPGKPEVNKKYLKIKSPDQLKAMFRYTGDSICFLSSHRGGPESHLCENSIPAFENTLLHTYSIMEIDPRYTKDSILVIHHDPTLQRTTTGNGRVSDFTLKELKQLRLKNMSGEVTGYRIHTLAEVLKWAKGRAILILDKKEVPIEDRVRIVEKYRAEAYTMIMAYTFEEAKVCYSMNKNIMMEVFIPSPEKVYEFDRTGVPWSNVVAFVSHQMPSDVSVFNLVHQRGALCILGTSRNLDLQVTGKKVADINQLEKQYNELFRKGVDIIETDIPVEVIKVVSKRLSSPSYRTKFVK